jgi:hypothetical protein
MDTYFCDFPQGILDFDFHKRLLRTNILHDVESHQLLFLSNHNLDIDYRNVQITLDKKANGSGLFVDSQPKSTNYTLLVESNNQSVDATASFQQIQSKCTNHVHLDHENSVGNEFG